MEVSHGRGDQGGMKARHGLVAHGDVSESDGAVQGNDEGGDVVGDPVGGGGLGGSDGGDFVAGKGDGEDKVGASESEQGLNVGVE